jgi:hypothetical protein
MEAILLFFKHKIKRGYKKGGFTFFYIFTIKWEKDSFIDIGSSQSRICTNGQGKFISQLPCLSLYPMKKKAITGRAVSFAGIQPPPCIKTVPKTPYAWYHRQYILHEHYRAFHTMQLNIPLFFAMSIKTA